MMCEGHGGRNRPRIRSGGDPRRHLNLCVAPDRGWFRARDENHVPLQKGGSLGPDRSQHRTGTSYQVPPELMRWQGAASAALWVLRGREVAAAKGR